MEKREIFAPERALFPERWLAAPRAGRSNRGSLSYANADDADGACRLKLRVSAPSDYRRRKGSAVSFRYEVMNREENCLHWSLEDDGVSKIPLAILANDFNSRKRVYIIISLSILL